jgi:predicted alpha-1,6-mannanase (GH76 family)
MSGIQQSHDGQQNEAEPGRRELSRRAFLGAGGGLSALSLGAGTGIARAAVTQDPSPKRSRAPSARDFRAYAAAGISALQQWYDPSTGLWATTGWWNSANALNAVIQYTQRTGDDTYAGVIETTFTAAQGLNPGFIDDYYDDNGWWALTWVAAYDLTGDTRYLETARTIFATNTTGWDDVCRGGVWWNVFKNYKNAIPNELFLTLAARLHQRTPGDRGPGSYLDWAVREWEWFAASGLIDALGLVNDGLTPACENNRGVTWTYNQGVILGGLVALYEITGDRAYLERAEVIAGAALRYLTTPAGASAGPPGVLVEPCELAGSGCDGDQTQFKGIFTRNLYDLYTRSGRPAYRAFILNNARSIWDNGRNADNQFGLRWTGPFDVADASRQSSALDALNAALALAPAERGASPRGSPARQS